MKEIENGQETLGGGINYYVVLSIFIVLALYGIGNAITPQLDAELDFFELSYTLAQAAASVFAFAVAKRYWRSKIFGRAYLSLAVGYAAYFVGTVLWLIFQIEYGIANPYPYWPDIGYFLFYPFAIYHLARNVHFFKRRLERSEKYLLGLAPATVTIVYIFLLLSSVGSSNPTSGPGQQLYDQQFWNGLFMGATYVGASTVMFSYALIGRQIFRNSLLGAPWGLLLLGLTLNWAGDFSYYYSSIYFYDRTNPIIVIWMASYMIVCYALYKHREL